MSCYAKKVSYALYQPTEHMEQTVGEHLKWTAVVLENGLDIRNPADDCEHKYNHKVHGEAACNHRSMFFGDRVEWQSSWVIPLRPMSDVAIV